MSKSVGPVPERWSSVPRYAKGTCLDSGKAVLAALATETAAPLPPPPPPSFLNKEARATVKKLQEYFKIVTPINVDLFEKHLEGHPNQKFVKSVCRGLRQGFWPWADVDDPNLWKKHDNSKRPINQPDRMQFVREQRDEEVKLGRWSSSFGSDLLPGMYSSPIGVVQKSQSNKFRLVNDHSQEPYSPNSTISSEPDFPLDNIADLVNVLLSARDEYGDRKRVLWKSDVKSAYRLLPMNPLWQIRQIVTIDGKRYIDRCNTFGSRAGGWVWASFSSLVLWIAIKVKGIKNLLGYVDDHFGWDFADNMLYYEPYRKFLPANQARYLKLWDELGIPHDEEKQLHGSPLTIIGMEVDPNRISVRLPTSRLDELFNDIDDFAREGQKHPLLKFKQLAGSIEWALVACPRGRPGISGLHEAMSGRDDPKDLIPVNARTCRELRWLKDHIRKWDGTTLKWLGKWKSESDTVSYVDACNSGIGLWIPSLDRGFQAIVGKRGIFDLEALAVISAVELTATLLKPSHLAIFSDSTNSVDMFESLNTQDEFRNGLLMAFVDIVTRSNIWCRVFHVPGVENGTADALSRFENQNLRGGMKVQPLDLAGLQRILKDLKIA